MRGRSTKSFRCHKRDREPSRIPKQKLIHLLKHRPERKQITSTRLLKVSIVHVIIDISPVLRPPRLDELYWMNELSVCQQLQQNFMRALVACFNSRDNLQ